MEFKSCRNFIDIRYSFMELMIILKYTKIIINLLVKQLIIRGYLYNLFGLKNMSSKKNPGLNYFSEDSAGFKIQPKTVLIMSLVYIGIVVLLHIYSKLGAVPVK